MACASLFICTWTGTNEVTGDRRGVTTIVELKSIFCGGIVMLRLAILFLVLALIGGLLGFNIIGGMAFVAAKVLFFVFIVLAVLAFLGGALRTPPA
jgi:uncharacterized membrane protein YtjA (UPF0391 family)